MVENHMCHRRKKSKWKKDKELLRKVIATLNVEYPHMTRNWQKMHPFVYKANWKY